MATVRVSGENISDDALVGLTAGWDKISQAVTLAFKATEKAPTVSDLLKVVEDSIPRRDMGKVNQYLVMIYRTVQKSVKAGELDAEQGEKLLSAFGTFQRAWAAAAGREMATAVNASLRLRVAHIVNRLSQVRKALGLLS